jgi:hypothetical protein
MEYRQTAFMKGSKYERPPVTYTGHTQKNDAVLIVIPIETAPFFCVCPVFTNVFI